VTPYFEKNNKTLNNKVAKNVAILTGGTVFAQLLNILLTPFLQRYIHQKNMEF